MRLGLALGALLLLSPPLASAQTRTPAEHGRDERIGVRDLYAPRPYLHRLIEELASGN